MCRCVCVGEKGGKEKKRVDEDKKRRRKGKREKVGGGGIERKIHNMLMHECSTIKLDKYVPEDIQAFPRLCILSQLLNQCSSQGEPSEVAAQISIQCSQFFRLEPLLAISSPSPFSQQRRSGKALPCPLPDFSLSLK